MIEYSVYVWPTNYASDGGEIWDVGGGRKTGVLRVSEEGLNEIHKDGFEVPCSLLDTDQDRLSGCKELDLGTNPLKEDTDDDGLLDGDEVLGTVRGLDLPAMGANPRRKDLLVEMDWTDDAADCPQHSHRPTTEVLERVRAFYAAAPVSNPDGSTGIHFIADVGQGGPFTGGNFIAIPAGVTSNLGEPYRAYKAANFATNRHGYFRYQLHGHRTSTDPAEDQGGVAALNGDDGVVTMHCERSARNTFIVIVHELGHNLGLGHGGADDRHGKPNYNSVMNIRFNEALDVDCDTFRDLAADQVGTRTAAGTRSIPRPGRSARCLQAGSPAAQADRLELQWRHRSGHRGRPGVARLGTVVSDHDDYAALRIPPFAPQGRGEPTIDKLGSIPGAPARISGPCFPAMPKSSPQAAGPICPHPSPVR